LQTVLEVFDLEFFAVQARLEAYALGLRTGVEDLVLEACELFSRNREAQRDLADGGNPPAVLCPPAIARLRLAAVLFDSLRGLHRRIPGRSDRSDGREPTVLGELPDQAVVNDDRLGADAGLVFGSGHLKPGTDISEFFGRVSRDAEGPSHTQRKNDELNFCSGHLHLQVRGAAW